MFLNFVVILECHRKSYPDLEHVKSRVGYKNNDDDINKKEKNNNINNVDDDNIKTNNIDDNEE